MTLRDLFRTVQVLVSASWVPVRDIRDRRTSMRPLLWFFYHWPLSLPDHHFAYACPFWAFHNYLLSSCYIFRAEIIETCWSLRLWKLKNGPQEADMLSADRPIQTEQNRAELHNSCAVYNALAIKSRDRQLMGAATVHLYHPNVTKISMLITLFLRSSRQRVIERKHVFS